MYSKQPKYKAVIFDFDDTLVKSHTLKWAHHKAAAKRFYNKDITDEDMQKVWGKPFPLLVETLHSDVDTVENAIKNIRSMDAEFLKETQEDAPHILTQFLDVGIEIGIVSAADGAYVKKDLERLQFPAERFFSIQGCEDTDAHKPDPNVFIPIFKKLQEKGITSEIQWMMCKLLMEQELISLESQQEYTKTICSKTKAPKSYSLIYANYHIIFSLNKLHPEYSI